MGLFTEEFREDWVSNPDDLMFVNRMHNRAQPLATNELGLTLRDTSDAMTAEVVLPDTSAGRDASVEFNRGLLRGMSLEFRTVKEEYDNETDHRVIVSGRMFGFALVDRPAYPDSVAELKRAMEYRAHYGFVNELPAGSEHRLRLGTAPGSKVRCVASRISWLSGRRSRPYTRSSRCETLPLHRRLGGAHGTHSR